MSSRKFRDDGHEDDDDAYSHYSRASSIVSRRSSSSSDATHKKKKRTSHQQRRMYGAGIASGLVGLILGGPVVAIVAGFGTAYATEQPGAAGDAARAIGDAAIKAQEVDREHRIVDRTKDVAIRSLRAIAEYVREHQLIEHGIEVVGKVAYWVAEKLSEQILAHRNHRPLEHHRHPGTQ